VSKFHRLKQRLKQQHDVQGIGLAWYDAEAWKRLEAMPEAGIEMSKSRVCS
jgi:hypothetical protein